MSFLTRLTAKVHRGRVRMPKPEPDVFDLIPPSQEVEHLEASGAMNEPRRDCMECQQPATLAVVVEIAGQAWAADVCLRLLRAARRDRGSHPRGRAMTRIWIDRSRIWLTRTENGLPTCAACGTGFRVWHHPAGPTVTRCFICYIESCTEYKECECTRKGLAHCAIRDRSR